MKVILMERVERLGQMGDVVTVKDGFARNYLLPQGKALRATKDNIGRFDGDRAQLEAQNLARRQDAEQVAERMADLSVVLIRQSSDTGQLYGSVNARDIAESVSGAGFTVERRQVVLGRPIKLLGIHPIRVQLHPEVGIEVKVNVARSEEEAAAQAAGRSIGEVEEEAEALAAAEEIFEEEALERRREEEAEAGAVEDEISTAAPVEATAEEAPADANEKSE